MKDEFGEDGVRVALVESGGGVMDVVVAGELVHSKKKFGHTKLQDAESVQRIVDKVGDIVREKKKAAAAAAAR